MGFLFLTQFSYGQERLTLETFIERVRSQNLGLKIESAKSQAADSKSMGLGITPPMVGLMQTKQSGDSATGIEIDQTIPFPSKLLNDRSARKYEASAQNEMRLSSESETLAKAKYLYFSLWAAGQRLSLYREKKGIIEEHIKLSRAGARSDSFLRLHQMRAESDLDLLENETLSSEQALKEIQAEVAEFLNVDASSFHPTLQEPPLSEVPKSEKLNLPHQLESAKFTLESLKSRESEGKSSWLPDLYFRYKQMGQMSMYPQYSEIMVGVSLPFVFFWEPSSTSGKVSAERLRGEYELARAQRQIETEKEVLLSRAQSLNKQLENINQKLLPRAEKRVKLAHNIAPRDMETLQDHRETMEAFPDLKLRNLDLRGQYEEAVAGLRKYERDLK